MLRKFNLFFVLIGLCVFSTRVCFGEEEDFSSKLYQWVRECVDYNKLLTNKNEIFSLIDQLESNHFVLEKGSDELRIKYVSLQGTIEHVLACCQALKEIYGLIGMIHTPMPATPLCTQTDPFDQGLLDESIRHDPDKLLTVRARAQIMREYLLKGGKLFVVYPKGGLEKRTKEQQSIYLQELETYKNHLFDWVLKTSTMNADISGATYFFRDQDKEIYAFSIKSYQANDPKEFSEWGLWFGKIKERALRTRLNTLFDYFKTCGGPTKTDFYSAKGLLFDFN